MARHRVSSRRGRRGVLRLAGFSLAVAGALVVHAPQAARAAALQLERPDTSRAARVAARAAHPGRSLAPVCNLVRQDAVLGPWRMVNGRRVPVRAAGSGRAEMLRLGEVEPLRLGSLAAEPAAGVAAGSVPYQDTIRVLVVRIEFETDRDGSKSTGTGRFDLSPPDTVNVPVDPTPHDRAYTLMHVEALRRYYEATTAGRLVLEYDVYPQPGGAYRVTDMADFGPWEFSQAIYDRAYYMFRTFADSADAQGNIPWGDFDRVVFQHAGSDLQSDVRQDSPRDIPTFTIGVPDSQVIPLADSTYFLQAGMILPETTNQDGFFAALNAVFAHECGHLIFGWRDIYDIFTGLPTVGEWSLMDTGNLTGTIVQAGTQQFFAIGLLPPLTDPYQMHLVWDDVPRHDPPVWGAVDSLTPPQLSQRAIRVPISSEEYLLLENRRADLNGDNQIVLVRDPATRVILGPGGVDSLEYDFLLPGDGILAWHVDESIVGFDPPGRRADEFFSLNGNRERFGLQIFEADGLDDLGDFTSPYALGAPYDPFFVPNNARLEPGGRPPLITNSETHPHLAVEFLDSLRLSMRLRVTREWAVNGWPVVVRPGPNGVDPLALDFALGRRVVFSAADSALHALHADGSPGGVGGSDVLWKAPAALSRVAELMAAGDVYAAAVHPDPETLADDSGTSSGSTIVALDASGADAAGFPHAVASGHGNAACRRVTAGPAVVRDGTNSWIVVGTRCGTVLAVRDDGFEREIAVGGGPVQAIAAFHDASGRTYAAFADSSGAVGVGIWSGAVVHPSYGTQLAAPGWQPRLAVVSMNEGAGGSTQAGVTDGLPELVVLDRAGGRGWILDISSGCPGGLCVVRDELLGVRAPIADAPAAGDLDGDGFHEVVLATHDGRIGFWGLSGGATPGWPAPFDDEPFATRAGPLVADLDGLPGLELVHATGGGRIFALDAKGQTLTGWPIGTGAGQVSSPALLDVDGEGTLELLVADADSLLYAYHTGAAVGGAVWPVWGADGGRSFAFTAPPAGGGVAGSGLLVSGSLVAYPNPAKRKPVVVTFSLTQPAQARMSIFDTSGREVARLKQSAFASDNHLVWEPGTAAPGLYLGRLELEGGGRQETHMVRFGILH